MRTLPWAYASLLVLFRSVMAQAMESNGTAGPDTAETLAHWMAIQGVALALVASLLFYAGTAAIGVIAPGWFKELEPSARTLCRTGLTSYVHSLVSGFWTTWIIVTMPEILKTPSAHQDWHSLAATAMSCGYFIADLLLMLWKRTFLDTPLYLVHVHHVIVITCLWLCLYVNPDLSAYMVLTLVCEVNNWFLHGGKLLRRVGVPTYSIIYRCNDVLFYISFFIFRMGPHVFALVSIAGLRDAVPQLWQWWLGVVCGSLLVLINISMLFDFIRSRKRMSTVTATHFKVPKLYTNGTTKAVGTRKTQ